MMRADPPLNRYWSRAHLPRAGWRWSVPSSWPDTKSWRSITTSSPLDFVSPNSARSSLCHLHRTSGSPSRKSPREPEPRALVPGAGAELESLYRALDVLGEAGVATWLPSKDLMATCADRHALSATLASLAPIRLSESPRAAEQTGRPFEADLLAGQPGTLVAAIPRWRLATLGSETMAAETFARDDIACLLRALCSSIGLEGPATVSGFVDDDGKSMITGVSLGFSSCVALNAAAGADIVGAYTKKLRGECLPGAPMPYRSGVRMVRHLDEVFET